MYSQKSTESWHDVKTALQKNLLALRSIHESVLALKRIEYIGGIVADLGLLNSSHDTLPSMAHYEKLLKAKLSWLTSPARMDLTAHNATWYGVVSMSVRTRNLKSSLHRNCSAVLVQ